MTAERVQRAIEIMRRWRQRAAAVAADGVAASECEEVLDVLVAIELPPPRTSCPIGPEQCCCLRCWPGGPAA